MININYLYFLEYLEKADPNKEKKIFDFGCGRGELAQLLKDRKFNISGVDTYYSREIPEIMINNELVNSRDIKVIKDGDRLPFEDNYFDIIVSNQVFEHLKDLNFTISELDRVLKDNGVMYHHFPTKDTVWEGHVGIPFVHQVPKSIRKVYFYIFSFLGFGLHRNPEKTYKEWVNDSLDRLNNLCYYRKFSEIEKIIKNFGYKVTHKEKDYLDFRIRKKKMSFPKIFLIFSFLFRKIFFSAIEIKK